MKIRGMALCVLAGIAPAAHGQTLDQSRAYAAELASDASARTSSLAQKAGDFTVNVHGFTQFRFNFNHRDDSALDKENTIGFQNAKTRVILSGNIGNENWGYLVNFTMADRSSAGTAILDDAYGTYKMEGGWTMKFGQYKLPLYREESMSDTSQLFANRSVANSVFTQSRSQAFQASYEGDATRFFAAFSDGLNTRNLDFNSPAEADWALTGRFEYKWAGDWKQFGDFTSFQNSAFAGMFGVAAHWQSGGDTGADPFTTTNDVDILALTGDVSIEGNGWNAFAAVMWNRTEFGSGGDFDDWGFLVQGGIFINAQWELIGSWDSVIPDGDRSNDETFNTIRIGVNHYFIPDSHAAKLTIDLSYFLDTQSESIVPANTLTGLLASDADSQFNLRGQIQLVF